MELKKYQKEVISDLWKYLELSDKDYIEWYNQLWAEKGLPINPIDPKSLPSYQDTITWCPHVCLKVPTAWWKTFIACNALKTIFDNYPKVKEKVVVWLVPSNTILNQTIKNLSNPDHPYNQKIRSLFNGRFEVFTKEQLLNGTWFNLTSIQEQLNILVLSFASLRAKDKESRKLHQENGNLSSFQNDSRFNESYVDWIDVTSLSNILYNLNPVVIIDESHNAESDLSVDMLKTLNPSFILDLTATPKKNSNIISYVSAIELKKENMVKLPVIAYNMQDKEEVITSAIDMQRNLENIAKENEKHWWDYIRPIVIFQAQPKNWNEDESTYTKIKENLIKLNIPENQIAIQTATIKELNNVDLLSKDCEIRYIITINALKEWWDCPFAYVLASLANKSSEVDVTQILWRILRQPFTKKYENDLLNMSYVFTASQKFHETLDSIIEWLNHAGFSKIRFRVSEKEEWANEFVIAHDESTHTNNSNEKESEDWDFSKIHINSSSDRLKNIQAIAIETNREFEEKIAENPDSNFFWTWLEEKIAQYQMDSKYRNEVIHIKLPRFYMKIENGLFDNENWEKLVEKVDLYTDFKLLQQDSKFDFEDYDNTNIKQIDVQESNWEYTPKISNANLNIRQKIVNYIKWLPWEKQIDALVDIVFDKVKNENSIPQLDLKKYIKRVIEWFSPDQLESMKEHSEDYAWKIRRKIERLKDNYAKEYLENALISGKIYCKESWSFPIAINPTKTMEWITKSLYEVEWDVNDFERTVIDKIANSENVERWHRNLERKWFYINGQIYHYPDFIVKTKRWNILLIETKWDDRDNSDSMNKIQLWELWDKYAWNQYKYFMIFENNALNWAKTVDDFMKLLKDL